MAGVRVRSGGERSEAPLVDPGIILCWASAQPNRPVLRRPTSRAAGSRLGLEQRGGAAFSINSGLPDKICKGPNGF